MYGLIAALVAAVAALTPVDRHGNPVGATGRTLSTIVGAAAVAVMATGCYQLIALRRTVYGRVISPSPTVGSAGTDPVVAAFLAARSRRDESRSLAQHDPGLAHDLRIGRPDLPCPYDDGGLVDLNSAPAAAIASTCSLEPALAEHIVATRRELGSFSSFSEIFAFAEVEEGAATRIQEHGILLLK